MLIFLSPDQITNSILQSSKLIRLGVKTYNAYKNKANKLMKHETLKGFRNCCELMPQYCYESI